MSDGITTYIYPVSNAASSVALPAIDKASFLKLLSNPSKIIFRAYGPDSVSVWSAVVSLYTHDLQTWDPTYVVQLTISNADAKGVSIAIPSISEHFGVKVDITGTPGAAQTNGLVGISTSIQRGW